MTSWRAHPHPRPETPGRGPIPDPDRPELPQAGRPESFTGTVGPGYRLEVTADRSMVRVGDPIRLTLTLRGDAAVETAVLPPLTADGAKRFEITVRARHERVTAIPPFAFSWYDPERREYRATRSRPVALSVRPARIVSAADVVSTAPPGLDRFLAECDDAAYAPDGASRTLDQPTQAQATRLADRILQDTKR